MHIEIGRALLRARGSARRRQQGPTDPCENSAARRM